MIVLSSNMKCGSSEKQRYEKTNIIHITDIDITVSGNVH